MSGKYTRKLSFNERLFVVGNKLSPPMMNQGVFEGKGVLDVEKWRAAVAAASEANPGSRLVMRGVLGSCRWVDSGVAPPVIEIRNSGWSGNGWENAPFLKKPLDLKKGPTCEVLLLPDEAMPRVIFRTHHAVMDGGGSFTWVFDVMRALRGEPCVGSRSAVTDTELAKSLEAGYRTPYPTEHLPPTGAIDGDEPGFIWRRITIPGRPHNLLGQIAVIVAREAWKYSDGIVRFAIPVDMRQHQPKLLSTANLSYAVYIEVRKDTTPEQVSADIEQQLKEKREAMLTKGDDLVRYIPIWLLTAAAKMIINKRKKRGLYSISGALSNVGRIPLKLIRGGGWEATAFYPIPPLSDYVPFFLLITGSEDRVEMILSLPNQLATNGRMDAVLNSLNTGIR